MANNFRSQGFTGNKNGSPGELIYDGLTMGIDDEGVHHLDRGDLHVQFFTSGNIGHDSGFFQIRKSPADSWVSKYYTYCFGAR